jgi:hypothetical protein
VNTFESKGGAVHLWKILLTENFFQPSKGVLGKTCLSMLLRLITRFSLGLSPIQIIIILLQKKKRKKKRKKKNAERVFQIT